MTDQALISFVRVDTIVAMLLKRVNDTIERRGMLRRGETAVVAVSGGIDSVVLLDLLQRLAPDYGIRLHVAHLDHGLRGAAGTEDARFVERLADERGLPMHASRLDPASLDAHRGQGPEGAARAARHAFLLRTAEEIGAQKIALGHTADDQAETILHRLARGAGIAGLRGIPPVRFPFVRPLIAVTRSDVRLYANQRGLTWREDASNTDVSFARNRIRHRVLPELAAINPKIVEAICRASDHAAEIEDTNRFLVATLWEAARIEECGQRLSLRRSALRAYPGPVRKLMVREAVRRARGTLSGIERDHLDSVARWVERDRAHGELSLPGLHVRVQADEILFCSSDMGSPTPRAFPVGLGETAIPEPAMTLTLSVVAEPPPPLAPADRWSELADADRVRFPLAVRSRREGDRFTPLGLGTSLKLKDFLINERVPYFDRDRVALLCDQEKIVWVVGVRLSDDVRITDATHRFLKMQVKQRR
jgi:tRNA(Ile)-lysidine synthase